MHFNYDGDSGYFINEQRSIYQKYADICIVSSIIIVLCS